MIKGTKKMQPLRTACMMKPMLAYLRKWRSKCMPGLDNTEIQTSSPTNTGTSSGSRMNCLPDNFVVGQDVCGTDECFSITHLQIMAHICLTIIAKYPPYPSHILLHTAGHYLLACPDTGRGKVAGILLTVFLDTNVSQTPGKHTPQKTSSPLSSIYTQDLMDNGLQRMATRDPIGVLQGGGLTDELALFGVFPHGLLQPPVTASYDPIFLLCIQQLGSLWALGQQKLQHRQCSNLFAHAPEESGKPSARRVRPLAHDASVSSIHQSPRGEHNWISLPLHAGKSCFLSTLEQ
jgi:hypothetical protein